MNYNHVGKKSKFVRVLLVDDNQDLTTLLSEFLKEEGICSVIANDPRDGLEKIKSEKYDVILLDTHMPMLSGTDIIQTLEREKILKNQKIIIFSGADFTPIQIEDLLNKDGIQGHLKKPTNFSQLLTSITS